MDEHDCSSWMIFSKRDYDSARYLSTMYPPPVEVICFLCQQASEKALKAILVQEEVMAPRTHDLVALVQSMETKHPDLARLLPECVRLSTYAVAMRYPYRGDLPAGAETQALKDAEVILACVKKVLDS